MDKLKLALKVTDIDTVDELSRTALHFAITQRHTNIVWYLLNNKAKMDVMDKDGFTPFHKVKTWELGSNVTVCGRKVDTLEGMVGLVVNL